MSTMQSWHTPMPQNMPRLAPPSVTRHMRSPASTSAASTDWPACVRMARPPKRISTSSRAAATPGDLARPKIAFPTPASALDTAGAIEHRERRFVELQLCGRSELRELGDIRRADDRRRDLVMAQQPGESNLRLRLPGRFRSRVEPREHACAALIEIALRDPLGA